jgi:hypothetical protein
MIGEVGSSWFSWSSLILNQALCTRLFFLFQSNFSLHLWRFLKENISNILQSLDTDCYGAVPFPQEERVFATPLVVIHLCLDPG